MSEKLTALWVRMVMRPRPAESERGDVPGWVLITLMTAVLVAALLTIARRELTQILQDALELVKP